MEPIFTKFGNKFTFLMRTGVMKYRVNFGLNPEIELDEESSAFSEKELNEIHQLIIKYKSVISEQLDLFYQGKPVTANRI